MLKFVIGTLLMANSTFAAQLNCVDSKTKNQFWLIASILENDKLDIVESALQTDEIQITTRTYEVDDIKMENIGNHSTNYVFTDESCLSWFVLPNNLLKLTTVEAVFRVRCGTYPGIKVKVDKEMICNIQ